jgi:hypothetical protein
MRAMLTDSLVSAVAALGSPALAQTVTCITSSQGYRICDDGHGHSTTEWHWQGMTFGQDNQGNRWTTSRWRDIDITTVKRPDRWTDPHQSLLAVREKRLHHVYLAPNAPRTPLCFSFWAPPTANS